MRPRLLWGLLVAALLVAPVASAVGGQWVGVTFADGQVWRDVVGVALPWRPERSSALRRSAPGGLDRDARRAAEGLERQLTRAWRRCEPPSCLWPRTYSRFFNPGLDQPWVHGVPCAVAPIHEMPELGYGLAEARNAQASVLP